MGGQRHAPAALPWERPGTHCIGGWVGVWTGLDGCGKSRPPPGFDHRTVQPVAIRSNHCVIPAHTHFMFNNFFSENPSVYEIMWKHVLQPVRLQMTLKYGECALHAG
jgi:hypothetical protein